MYLIHQYQFHQILILINVNDVVLNLVADDTEDNGYCAEGNCYYKVWPWDGSVSSNYIGGYDEDWGSVAADNGNCSKSAKERPRCIPNGLGTSIIEEYNWTNNFLNGNVTLETKYQIKNNNIGKFNVSCYNNTGWQNIYDDY